ncbi:mitochondrial carrier homolog 1 isoform X6 [Xiphophorus couchianus]|uniref:mitochondrial carrier homolog 1 isoform X6 n=1 Tax=Xiphophorus couchianus TaxID=32473 RepID=UPI001016E1DE|nr:mitochondrial carrier homolog 1 isoform X6 [Xiphophorus couchianus]
MPSTPVVVDAAVVLLGATVTTITHPLLYVKLLIQVAGPTDRIYRDETFEVGHEPLPPAVGSTMLGRPVLYLPGFFSYAQYVLRVDGKLGLFRGLSPRIASSTISTLVRGKIEWTSHDMIFRCLSRVATHPFHVMSVRCMAQFVGRETKYSGVFSCIMTIFKEEGLSGFYTGFVPHVLGEVLFLWCCNLLAYLINTYAVDHSFSQASTLRNYTKFVMSITLRVLTYPFTLVADVMAVNNCGLAAGLPPRFPVFTSWLHCWNHLSTECQLFRGSRLFFRRVPVTLPPSVED